MDGYRQAIGDLLDDACSDDHRALMRWMEEIAERIGGRDNT